MEQLIESVVGLARGKVQAGEVSERGLARLCGMSQPHIHNVLKNRRALSPDSADRILAAFGLTAHDLLWRVPAEIETRIHAVPFLAVSLGPGNTPMFDRFRGYTPLPGSLVDGLVDPVTVRLGPDLAMPSELHAGDIALLDQNPLHRASPSEPYLWVISDSTGPRVRYVKVDGGRIHIGADIDPAEPREWRLVRYGARALDIVRARIVWIGRKMETPEAGSAGPAGARY